MRQAEIFRPVLAHDAQEYGLAGLPAIRTSAMTARLPATAGPIRPQTPRCPVISLRPASLTPVGVDMSAWPPHA
jgi:hypothetical protein